MRISKLRMFFILNGLIAFVLLIHLGRWIFSASTSAAITLPLNGNTITVNYSVNKQLYTQTYLRNDVPYAATAVKIRYLPANPSISRIDSFYGIYAESLAWWGVLLFALSVLLLTNNMIFSKGTIFEIHRRFPWIAMEEYFPVRIIRRRKYREDKKEDTRQQQETKPKYLE